MADICRNSHVGTTESCERKEPNTCQQLLEKDNKRHALPSGLGRQTTQTCYRFEVLKFKIKCY